MLLSNIHFYIADDAAAAAADEQSADVATIYIINVHLPFLSYLGSTSHIV